MSLHLPKVIFGSSALANLYERVPEEEKRGIVNAWVQHQGERLVIDSAGKYGAGLALQNIGRLLSDAGVDPSAVRISNKLGWKQVPMPPTGPTFDIGLWKDITHNVEPRISYDGILECYHQGNTLLAPYTAQLVSVHDPDEYLAGAHDNEEAAGRYEDVLAAYRALNELRDAGHVAGVGVGSKDWRLIQRLHQDRVRLDWVMFANSFTLKSHPPELMSFIAGLASSGVAIINSAVFNGGFLVGGNHYDYKPTSPLTHPDLYDWRERFHATCRTHSVSPVAACFVFGLSAPGICSLAINSSRPHRIAENVRQINETLPPAFWRALKQEGLLEKDYPYV